MSVNGNGAHSQSGVERPRWVGYAVTIGLEVILTSGLLVLQRHIPLGSYPITYILLIMSVAYLFGEGPAVLAFFVGLGFFLHFFVPPLGSSWPPVESAEGLARLIAFLLGTSVVGFTAVLMRRHSKAMQRLAAQLAEAKDLAEDRWSELEAILSSTPSAVIVIDSDQRVVYCNPAVAKIVPVAREVGEPIAQWLEVANVRDADGERITPEDHPLVIALRGHMVTDRLLLVQGESGPDTLLSATAAPIHDSKGAVTGSLVIYRNITLQHRLQQEVERQRSLMDAFMQNVPVGLVFSDTTGRTIIANRALAQINQVPIESMLGKMPNDYLPADLAAEVNEAIETVLATGEPVYWHDRRIYLHGERWFNVSYHPVRDADGTVSGVGNVVVDTTEQVRARLSLEETYERERKIAETLQSTLLGEVPRRINGFEFEKVYRAALDEAAVGGDFYDIFKISHDKIGIVIGDVSGKGLGAAVHVALAKYTIRGRAYESISPARVMEHVNETLIREMDSESFVTVFFGVIDHAKMTLTYANCGQAPAMLWNASDSKVESLQPTCPVAGSLSDVQFSERTIPLRQGDEILLGTDGIFEIRQGDGMLGLDAFQDIYTNLKRSGSASAAEVVERAVAASDGDLRDDVAVVRITVVEAPHDAPTWTYEL